MHAYDAEVAVVGLGAWGTAALWQLAERGVDCVGLERYGIAHALGASHGGSRMFRTTCLEHPGLVPLARRSLELWQVLQEAAGTRLFVPGGGLLIGPPGGPVAGGTLRAAERHGIAVQRLTPGELADRFPAHTGLDPHDIAVWEPQAGLVRPEATVRAAADCAVRAGARVLTGSTVTGLVPEPGGVRVATATGSLHVRRVVVSAGPWLQTLVPGLPLETVRMPLTWYAPDARARQRFTLERFPVFMRELPSGAVLWGCGSEGEHPVKLGLEYAGEGFRTVEPEDTDRSVARTDWESLSRLLARYAPGLPPVPERAAVGRFGRTPDGQFVLGPLPAEPRIIVAGGCNAHGGKHALGVGEALAELATTGRTTVPLEFTAPARFAGR